MTNTEIALSLPDEDDNKEALVAIAERSDGPPFSELATIDKVRWIKDNKTARMIDGVLVDLMTANAIITVYDAVGPDNKIKMLSLPIAKMGEIAWKLVR